MMTSQQTTAVEYYHAIGNRDVPGFTKFLDPHVEFYSPLASLKGKEAVTQTTTNFMNAITSLRIRCAFDSKDQAMVVYDVDIPGLANTFPGASLLTFRNHLIVRVELFHDASLFKKEF